MSIIERLESIQKIAQIARDDGNLRDDLGKVERATERISTLTRLLNKICIAFNELDTVCPDQCSLVLPDLQSIESELVLLVEHAKIVQHAGARQEFATHISSVEKTAKAIEKSFSVSWKSYRSEHPRPSIDRDLLQVFNRAGLRVDHLLETYDDAQMKLQLLEDFALPASGAVAEFSRCIQSLVSVSLGLADVVPSSIAEFFRQAYTPQGAPLLEFTEEVRIFLVEHQISSRYSVRGL